MDNETNIKNETGICRHEFIYDRRTRTLTYPSFIHGVCSKCGAVTKIKWSDFKNLQKGKK